MRTTQMAAQLFPTRTLYVFLSLCLVFFALLTLSTGETPFSQVLHHAQQRFTGLATDWNPLLDERLPRLLILALTGASLAVSGAVMQALFQNPLASPSILGINSGGSLAVLLVFLFNLHQLTAYTLALAAFCGCLATLLLVYALAKVSGHTYFAGLIVTGIALSTLLLAIQGTITYALRDHWQLIQVITEWEAGSSLNRSWKHVHMQFPLAIAGLSICWNYRQEIDLLSLGEEEALSLGVDVPKVRWRLFLAIAFLSAGALAALGSIAFFGLIVPHILRRLLGPSHRQLLPACLLTGAFFMVAMDFLLRLLGFYAFSLGHLCAIIGGLFFLLLLFRTRHSRYAW